VESATSHGATRVSLEHKLKKTHLNSNFKNIINVLNHSKKTFLYRITSL
jgi:hypothetical protein